MSEVVNLGKVSMTAEGNYDPSRSYDKLAVVAYNGLSWVSRKKVPEGVAPSEANSAFWQKISDRGERGPQGQSYVDREMVPIVDDLTTGGSANVLSAEQGKVLKQELTELESELGFPVIFTLYGESYGTYGTYNFPLKAGQTYYLSLIENKNNTISVYYEKQDGTRILIGQLVLGAEPKEWVCPEDAIGIYFGSNGLCKIGIYADALKQDVKRNTNKTNENAESIRTIVNTYGHYINNAEWSEVIVDAKERVLLGIRKDGVVVIGCGLEVPNNEIPEVFVFKVADKENRKEIKIDKEERIISFIDEQGVYNMELPFKVNSIILQDGNIFSSFKDLEEKLNLDKRYATIEDVEKTGGVYDYDIPRLYVESESLSPNAETDEIGGLNLSKNEVDCKYIYVSPTIRFTDTGTIAYQGNSTLYHRKKGFRFAFSKEHRFGEWIATDEYNGKGYFVDWMKFRDVGANKLLELFYKNRELSNNRPYKKYNSAPISTIGLMVESGELCHIDGFPIELYINNVYWGLYSFNLKKDRKNFLMDKSNTEQILVDASNDTYYTDAYMADGGKGWKGIEIRNPKKDDGNSSFDDGVEPKAGTTKVAWQSFIAKINAINTGTSIEELEEFLNVDEWVDALLFSWVVAHSDSWCKNNLYGTWDRLHWSPLIYDLDSAFGVSANWQTGVVERIEPADINPLTSKAYAYCPWLGTIESILTPKIETRYAYLRSKGVISIETITRMVNDWTMNIGADAYQKDIERWQYVNATTGLIITSETIVNWFKERLVFLDEKYNFNIE